jgi:hypothetical protein
MPRDFLEIVVHFVVSALAGALLAGLFLFLGGFAAYAGWIILGAALVFGIAGAVLGDRFWEAEWNPLYWVTYWWW